jgi:hypothetical protein
MTSSQQQKMFVGMKGGAFYLDKFTTTVFFFPLTDVMSIL